MGFLDAFTGGSVTSAAKGVASRAQSTGQNVDDWWGNSLQGGLGELDRGRADATSTLDEQFRAGNDASQAGYNKGRTDLTTNYGTANDYLGQIQGLYQPYAANGTAASTMLADATGLNGSTGNATATGAFQASPGYNWTVDQSTDAAARKAASLGIAGSGNTLTALGTLGANLANQEYSGWLDRLQTQVGTGMQATAGQAAGFGAQAQLASGLGSALAANDTGQGNAEATLRAGYGTTRAADVLGADTAMAGLYAQEASGVSNANVGLVGQANTAQMQAGQAQMQGSSNLWGALTGSLTAAAKGGAFNGIFG